MDENILYPEEPDPIPEDKIVEFQMGDSVYDTTLSDKYINRKPWEPVNLKVVKAVIPGIIRKLYVDKGAKVKTGDKLVVLEAMKMKNDLLATEGGVVDEILVKVGERVSKDDVLVRIR